MQYEVSMIVVMGRIANQSTKITAIQKLSTRVSKYLICINYEPRCVCVPNMMFPVLILWLGEVCTDATDTNVSAA